MGPKKRQVQSIEVFLRRVYLGSLTLKHCYSLLYYPLMPIACFIGCNHYKLPSEKDGQTFN